MPRNRRSSKTAQPDVSTTASDTNVTSTTQVRKEVKNMAAETLSADQISELLSKSRTKGAGEEVLQNFLDSGVEGIVVDLKTGPLAGKNANQAFSTLNNAKKRTKTTADNRVEPANPQFGAIKVIKRGKDDEAMVALINTELVSV